MRAASVGMLSLLCAGEALAGDPPRPIPPASLVGKSTFDGSRCRTVTPKLVAKMEEAYVCMPPAPEEREATASQRPIDATCKARKGHRDLLVFASAADCKEERLTQRANAESD